MPWYVHVCLQALWVCILLETHQVLKLLSLLIHRYYQVSFMQSGGFSPSKKVPTISSPSLILWGRQDGILEKEFANKVRTQSFENRVSFSQCLTNVSLYFKFLDTLPDARLEWIEECGHVPHLEKPEDTAEAISTFLSSTDVPKGDIDVTTIGAGFFGALALTEAFNVLSQSH